MSTKRCLNGHPFTKTSTCPVCPICSKQELQKLYGDEFPPIGAPALRALQAIGVTKLSQVLNYTDDELLALHGFGPRALQLLREKLHR